MKPHYARGLAASLKAVAENILLTEKMTALRLTVVKAADCLNACANEIERLTSSQQPAAVPAALSRAAEDTGHLPNQPHLSDDPTVIDGCECAICKLHRET